MKRNFNWNILPLFCMSTFLVAILATDTFAYPTYENLQPGLPGCFLCHPEFQTGPLHVKHSSLNINCNRCHDTHNFVPVLVSLNNDGNSGCVGCHGRSEDAGNDGPYDGLGAGLRQHHWSSGETSCASCHSDSNPSDYTPVGENVSPPFYTTEGLDPCTDLLDNDGDLFDDEIDPDCVLDTDSDGDGIPDFEDNCPDTCNTQQLDADDDNIGDVCDPDPGCGGCGQPVCETEC
jgi:hypothetical protein